jgi:hypothetical protein
MFTICISYPYCINSKEVDEFLAEGAKKFGGISGDSGVGFGQRDIEFDFSKRSEALKFKRRAEKNLKEIFEDFLKNREEFDPGLYVWTRQDSKHDVKGGKIVPIK